MDDKTLNELTYRLKKKISEKMYDVIKSDVVHEMTTDNHKRAALSGVLTNVLTLFDFTTERKLYIEQLISRCNSDIISISNGADEPTLLQNELAYSLASVSNRLSYTSLLEKTPEEITPLLAGIDENWHQSLDHIDDIHTRFQLAVIKEVNLHTEFGKQWAEYAQVLTERYLTLFKDKGNKNDV